MTVPNNATDAQRENESRRADRADNERASADMRAETSRAPVAEKEPVERRAMDTSAQESDRAHALFDTSDSQQFRQRWSDIQAGFVDQPRSAVERADELVGEVMQRLTQGFTEERRSLEQHLKGDGDADTEELRLAFRRFRSFFDRLLTL
jgi:hypothetical protein